MSLRKINYAREGVLAWGVHILTNKCTCPPQNNLWLFLCSEMQVTTEGAAELRDALCSCLSKVTTDLTSGEHLSKACARMNHRITVSRPSPSLFDYDEFRIIYTSLLSTRSLL